ncbi:MAG: hypothetical protein C5B58_06205 [Acidobacteria bacterium]|nr:MAG: hypothetical protein C5B58_06205 [Acidobacteriota bacterium]
MNYSRRLAVQTAPIAELMTEAMRPRHWRERWGQLYQQGFLPLVFGQRKSLTALVSVLPLVNWRDSSSKRPIGD